MLGLMVNADGMLLSCVLQHRSHPYLHPASLPSPPLPPAPSTCLASLLAEYERICLNAMEERVLPADVRIKIVFAQANAGDREEDMEANVRVISLYIY